MNWKFPSGFWGSGQEQNQVQDLPTQPWYPPSVVDLSTSSSRPSMSSSSSSINAHQRSDNLQSPSYGQPSPAEAAGTIARLKDKSVDELRKLLTDKDAYNSLFNSLEQVRVQNNLRDELQKETLQLAICDYRRKPGQRTSDSGASEPGGDRARVPSPEPELSNRCQIIRATELAAALEKLSELEKRKEETLKFYSPPTLLQKLQDANDKVEEESEMLHRQLLENQIDLSAFVQRHKKLRTIYHRRALIHLAAKTSAI